MRARRPAAGCEPRLEAVAQQRGRLGRRFADAGRHGITGKPWVWVRRGGGANDERDTDVPSPLVGEGGSPRSGETGEGYLSAKELRSSTRRKTPHPALRATFSHKGRRKKAPTPTSACRRCPNPCR